MSISIFNLRKKYKDNIILDSINIKFTDGKKYFIKGENGTGKSTLIKCILNHVKYDGLIIIDGRISYSPENPYYPPYMTFYKFIKTFSTLTENIENFDEKLDFLIKELNFDKNKLNSFIGSLSKGQRQKANLIQSLLTPSEILIIDEPLSGLDEESKEKFIKIIEEDKRLVIIISHDKRYYSKEKFVELELKDGRIKVLSKII